MKTTILTIATFLFMSCSLIVDGQLEKFNFDSEIESDSNEVDVLDALDVPDVHVDRPYDQPDIPDTAEQHDPYLDVVDITDTTDTVDLPVETEMEVDEDAEPDLEPDTEEDPEYDPIEEVIPDITIDDGGYLITDYYSGAFSLDPVISCDCPHSEWTLDMLSFVYSSSLLTVNMARNTFFLYQEPAPTGLNFHVYGSTLDDLEIECINYELEGSFEVGNPDRFTATWTAEFVGICSDCEDQSVAVTGTR